MNLSVMIICHIAFIQTSIGDIKIKALKITGIAVATEYTSKTPFTLYLYCIKTWKLLPWLFVDTILLSRYLPVIS